MIKGTERIVRLDNNSGPSKDVHFLSANPEFNFQRALRAKDFVYKIYGKEMEPFKALRVGLTLSLYNLDTDKMGNATDDDFLNRLVRLSLLVDDEKVKGLSPSPFPTVGIEVECPRDNHTPYLDSTYGAFFDLIEMPRNEINKGMGEKEYSVWEFSPSPSYSALTQARILSELIKGGFVSSLISLKDTSDIFRLLDEKGISLHVNLGIPKEVENRISRDAYPPLDNPDINFFVTAVVLAFTSPERLLRRRMTDAYVVKEDADKSLKNSKFRLEIKALEVRSKETYRLLYEAQSVAGALFAFLDSENDTLQSQFLAKKWQEIRGKLHYLFDQCDIDPYVTLREKKEASDTAKYSVSPILRHLIATTANEIKQGLQDKGLTGY